jgi:hypothetical protein
MQHKSKCEEALTFGGSNRVGTTPAKALRNGDYRRLARGLRFLTGPDSREPPALRPLRSHQRRIAGIVSAIVSGGAGSLRDVLAAVTPGGGKSVLPLD